MKEKIIKLLEEMEHYFETSGYYSAFAGYGLKNSDYAEFAEKVVKLFALSDVSVNKVAVCDICNGKGYHIAHNLTGDHMVNCKCKQTDC